MYRNDTFLLAARARSKLTSEANKSEHNLRKLVGHANLLDNMMERIEKSKYELSNEPLMKHNPASSVKFSPLSAKVTVIEEEDYEAESYDYDEQSQEVIFDASEVSSDEESDDDEDYGEWVDYGSSQISLVKLSKVTSSNFRELINYEDEDDDDLESLEDYSSDSEEEEESNVPQLHYSSDDDSDELDTESELNEKSTKFWEEVSCRDQLVERAHITKSNRLIDNSQQAIRV